MCRARSHAPASLHVRSLATSSHFQLKSLEKRLADSARWLRRPATFSLADDVYIRSVQAGPCGRAAGVKGVKEIDGKACVQLMATADRGSMLICGLQLAAGILERPQAQFLGTLVAEADGLQVTQGMLHFRLSHGTNSDR